MGLLSRLFAGPPRAPSAEDAQEQRRQLGKQMMTPERQELIARAMSVRRAKQALLEDLAGPEGAERLAEALRRMMADKR